MSFDSKLVRLKAGYGGWQSSIATNLFRFQTGSIKRRVFGSAFMVYEDMFRFQTGSIKSRAGECHFAIVARCRFDSKLVRLKEVARNLSPPYFDGFDSKLVRLKVGKRLKRLVQ